jgi:hypothetical protein
MKKLFAILALLFGGANTVMPQETICFVDWTCDNGDSVRYIFKKTNEFTVRVNVSGFIEGSVRYLRCNLNGNTHHLLPITGNGLYETPYEGVGLGNPDHSITLSVMNETGNTTSNDISLGNINVWMWAPEFLDNWSGEDGGLVSTVVTISDFVLPTGSPGYGGCFEHQLVLANEAEDEGSGNIVYSYEQILTESFVNQTFYGTFPYDGPLTELCVRHKLILRDFGNAPGDLVPQLILSSEDFCFLAGEISTSVPDGSEGKTLSVWPNPFTDHLNVSSFGEAYEFWSVSGQLVSRGVTGTGLGQDLAPGVYVLTIGASKFRVVKQ